MDRLQAIMDTPEFRTAFYTLYQEFLESGEEVTSQPLLDSLFRKTVMPLLGEWPRVTIKDLAAVWCRVWSDRSFEDPEAHCLARFAEVLLASAQRRWSSGPIGVGPAGVCGGASVQDDGIPLWCSEDQCLAISWIAALPVREELVKIGTLSDDTPWLPPKTKLYVQLTGACSEEFFRIFCSGATSVISMLLQCVADRKDEAWEEALADAMAGRGQKKELLRRFINYEAFSLTGEPPIPTEESESIYDSARFLRDGVAAFLEDAPTKKDSIGRRLRNAIRLMVEADNQSHNAIGLALSVTAIEAMLCRRGPNVTEMFRQNMAALLEPDPNYRDAAERWSNQLYDLRSGILHGSEIDCPQESVRHAKVAAGAVLRGMLERRTAMKRLGGDDEDVKGFFAELQSGRSTPGQLTHVSETPLKYLWRKGPAKLVE